uniref:Lipase domain-containing protein n=1 Tax=Arion vulgaris TaxID=1028688 RepID=A0A0B7A5U0_9EUPU
MLFLMCAAMLMATVEMEPLNIEVANKEVCYDAMGCFNDGSPFRSTQRPTSIVPQSPDIVLTKFVLYTRESRDIPQILDARYLETIPQGWTNFKARPTKILIHGFMDSIFRTTVWIDIKEELLKNGDYNVILVDWSLGNLLPLTQATANTRIVGAQTSELVKALITAIGVTPADFHIIGHSLGAHTSGYAGERIPSLGRITGLDPAGPGFEGTDKVVRIDESDAVFVDVIYTNSDSLANLGLGTRTISGHANFFPNLGHHQPGCRLPLLEELTQFVTTGGVLEEIGCSHSRVLGFFNESINSPCLFLAFPCASEEDYINNLCQSCSNGGCGFMGFHADKNIPPAGQQINYYLTTGASSPFCRPLFVSVAQTSRRV